MSSTVFSNGLEILADQCNSFILKGSNREECKPFYVDGVQVGLVNPQAWKYLSNYTDVFLLQKGKDDKQIIALNPTLQSFEARSQKIAKVFWELNQKDAFPPLRGWRDETYDIKASMSSPPVMKIERSATDILGLVHYGTHINGYCYQNGELMMWIGHRSKTKATFPGMMDNMAAGGLSSGLGIRECAEKECEEEASIPKGLLKNLKQVGCVSFFREEEGFPCPECEFTFDLLLPKDFVPVNSDNEVSHFDLMSIDKVKEEIIGGNFKPNSAFVIVDFMIRHGIITMENEPNYCYLVERLHYPLQTFYNQPL